MTSLKEGDKAPDFKAFDTEGNIISLKSLKGKKIILYFYPADLTPTCTVEACNFRDNFNLLRKKGYEIIGISPDDVKTHKRFAERNKLPFTLLADTDRKIIDAYGVWGPKKLYGREYMGLYRTTFVINEKGKIEKVITKVKSKQATEQILQEAGKK
jgi:peroxiredoxin Q/BCP